jgi:Neuraminidase (sialidase)
MNKISIALVGVVLAGLTAPVLASDTNLDGSTFDEFSVVAQLRENGVNAVAANDNWNGKIRVTVADANGKQSFQYFYEDTLQPVLDTAPQTRVLTKIDTGLKASAPLANEHSQL